jgi:uncharacterized protein (TIGR03492 family)
VGASPRRELTVRRTLSFGVTTPPTLLLISNGHGEDVVAARLAGAFAEARPDLRIRALPTVGDGAAFRDGPALRIGPLRRLPSGGMTMRSLSSFAADVRAGLAGTTFAQFRDLRAARADVLVAVGDAWCEALGLVPRARGRYAVQTIVPGADRPAAASLGIGALRERFTGPEVAVLRVGYRAVYARDAAASAALRAAGVRGARSLGNPMMDGLSAPPLEIASDGPRVALLPGTRGHAGDALRSMAEALERLPAATAVAPWAAGPPPSPPPGWTEEAGPFDAPAWRHGGRSVVLAPGRFAATLGWAELAIGTAGTAHEQAAGLGVPVVAFPAGDGHGEDFLAGQRRQLGEALVVVAPTPAAVADAARTLLADPDQRRWRGRVGRDRMGAPGAAAGIAADLLADAVEAGLPPADASGPPAGVASASGEAA